MAGLTFEVFSAGVSFTTEESLSKSKTVTVPVPPNQNGAMGFTAGLRCVSGTLTCDDGTVEDGDACSPQTTADGDDSKLLSQLVSPSS